MAFNFNWSPLTADASFYRRARDLLTTALNKSPKPPIIVDDIIVTEFNLGSVPDLEILEIGDLAEDRFRGIFKMCYSGDAFLTLKTRVQVGRCFLFVSVLSSSRRVPSLGNGMTASWSCGLGILGSSRSCRKQRINSASCVGCSSSFPFALSEEWLGPHARLTAPRMQPLLAMRGDHAAMVGVLAIVSPSSVQLSPRQTRAGSASPSPPPGSLFRGGREDCGKTRRDAWRMDPQILVECRTGVSRSRAHFYPGTRPYERRANG